MIKFKIVLIIVGIDLIGGVGVMVDLKLFYLCGVYGMGVVISIVV